MASAGRLGVRGGLELIGSGLRRSKLFVTGEVLAALPGADIVEGLGVPVGA